MAKSLIFLSVFLINVLEIITFPKEEYHSPKGRSWEYGTKIEHPAPKHGYHHKGYDYKSKYEDLGKGLINTYDSGDKHYGKSYGEPYDKHVEIEHKIPIKYEIPTDIENIDIKIPPIHTIPIHIPQYVPHIAQYAPDYNHGYAPKEHYPVQQHVIHYEPKKVESPKQYEKYEKKDSLDINIDGIIDDINRDLKKTTNYVS